MDTASTLQRELKQRRPFTSPAHEAVVALLLTTELLRRRHTAVLEPWDVTLQQYNVLRILKGAGDAGLPTLEVAQRMVEQTPGVTRLLDRLEQKRLVTRKRCERDRRQHLCWITEQGLAVLAQADGPMRRGNDASVRKLSAAELGELTRLLALVRAGCSDPSEQEK